MAGHKIFRKKANNMTSGIMLFMSRQDAQGDNPLRTLVPGTKIS